MIIFFYRILLVLGLTSCFAFAEVIAGQSENTGAAIQVKTTDYNESTIPLVLKASPAVEQKSNPVTQLILTLLIVATFLGVGFYLVKKYSQKNINSSTNMQIKILAQHHLGPKKSLAVIRVGGESVLLGITDTQINLIKGLSLLDEDLETTLQPTDRSTYKKVAAMAESTQDLSEEMNEDFSFADLKSTVTKKLKSVRGFQ